MAAAINFYVNPATSEFNLETGGSGLGFYGDSGFGASVIVGEWQGRTYITDGNGVIQGSEGQNVKYLNSASGILGQASSGIGLTAIPNYQSTLNIRFTYDSAVQVQNAAVRIYDRSNINNPASGVTTKVAEIIHPSTVQGPTGSGDNFWLTPGGSGSTVGLSPSPGLSGWWAGDGSGVVSTRTDTTHDWYLAISASPDSIGSKTQYGLYASMEYL